MKKKLLNKIRNIVPLKYRIKIGPTIAKIDYQIQNTFFASKKPKIMTASETINILLESDQSLVRFGDGEISLMENQNLQFQEKNIGLAQELREIIKQNDSHILVCVPGIWNGLNHFSDRSRKFYLHHLFRYRDSWNELIEKNRIYGESFISRPFLNYKDDSIVNPKEIFSKFKMIWNKRNILIIEGEKSRIGYGNDLFEGAASVSRILCPAENAYGKVADIVKAAIKHSDGKIVLVSLGPTAKIVVNRLSKRGIRSIDIGHLDMEYEMYKIGSKQIIPVKYKYFSEINFRDPIDCTDEKYTSQIVKKII